MTAKQIRKKYLKFFQNKKHVVLPSASLVPENDPTVLFTTAGMHPLVPFLMGEPHPAGERLASCQKCIRTGDIEDVGDRWHLTFFEMLGNWSLGNYFKEEAIKYSWEFLTHRDWLNLEKDRIYVSVFEGDKEAVKDEETYHIWRDIIGLPEERIFYFGRKENWWGPAGATGPCGPDTEIFYDTGLPNCNPECNPACSCGKYVEIWNNVFMQYNKKADNTYEKLKQQNVDTGMGLERIAAVMQNVSEIYETDLFLPIMNKIKELAEKENDTSIEVIADHLRAATFMIADGISPSNVDQGYVLRRLIRRAIRHGKQLGIENDFCSDVAKVIIDEYHDFYPELQKNKSEITMELVNEEEKFKKTLNHGLKELKKIIEKHNHKKITAKRKPFKNQEKKSEYTINAVSPKDAFNLYQSYGFPLELINEELAKSALFINENEFNLEYKKHQKLSKQKSQGKFAGGLADASEQSKKYHTATHLLHKALRLVLGEHVQQKGSNINDKRLRFDFTHPEKMADLEIKNVEDLVNEQIQKSMEIKCEEMSLKKALKEKAISLFTNKYGERVKVYSAGDFSKEICGGPHVQNTKELGVFKIVKEQSSSAGVRRIKAILE